MTKLTTIKAPVSGKRTGKLITIDLEGRACWLYVGTRRHKFFLHRQPLQLSHWKSGMRVGSLDQVRLNNLRTGQRKTDRAMAVEFLDSLVARLGADKVNKTIDEAKEIN